MSGTPDAPALVREGTKRAGVVWVRPLDRPGRPRPVWHVWRDDAPGGPAAYLVCGGEEQPAPGLAAPGRAEVVTPGKDTRARLVTWTADVTRVRPADPDWAPAVTALAAARLNAPDHPTLTARWATADAEDRTQVLRLTPVNAP